MHSSLYREVHGDQGPHLLLVHGMLSSRAQWMYNVDELASICRLVVVELMGHARSPSPEGAEFYTPAHYVAEFEAIREEVGADLWFICGQSLGAALTLRYSLDHPHRVIGQVFTNSNSALASSEWAQRVLPLMEAQSGRLESEGRAALEGHPLHPGRFTRLPAEAREALVADYGLHSVGGIARTGLYTVPQSSVRERAQHIAVPTLLVTGERERGFAEARRYAEETIPGMTTVALNAGHAVNLESAAEFNGAVSDFIRALTPT